MDPYEPDTTPTFSADDVHRAINNALTDIEEALDLPENGTLDALNLLLNATIVYLGRDNATLTDVANEMYDNKIDEILSWIE